VIDPDGEPDAPDASTDPGGHGEADDAPTDAPQPEGTGTETLTSRGLSGD
jgi:hypothetical protein